MEFTYIGYDVDTQTLMERVRVLQVETTKLLDILVNREMLSESAEEVQIDENGACPRPNGEECEICAYTFKKRIIINRADITKSIVRDKVLTCHSFEAGIYAHVDVKPSSVKKGVVYFGSAGRVKGRVKHHMSVILGNHESNMKPVHKHFIKLANNEEEEKDDDDVVQDDDDDSSNLKL